MTLDHRSNTLTSRRPAGEPHLLQRWLRRVTACALIFSALATPAVAASVNSYAGLSPISDDVLRAKRGGIMVAGVDFDFGAIVRVLVANQLVAETHLTLNPNGTMSQTVTIHDPALASQFTDLSQLQGSGIQINGGPQGAIGVVVQDSHGVSLALNHINGGQIFGLLANNAPGRNITQTIDANLTINNFSQLNAGLLGNIAAGKAMGVSAPDLMLH